MQMSVQAMVSRYWPPAVMGATSTAVLTVSINFATDGKPGWWWIVVGLGGLGMAGATVWAYALQRDGAGDAPAATHSEQVAQQAAGVAQQSATGNGANVSIHADNNSAAAWEMGTVNIGQERRNPTSET